MKHALYTPQDPKVSRIISCIGYVEMEWHDRSDGWFGLFPNGSSNLTISLNDKPVKYSNNEGLALLYPSWNSPVALKKSKSLSFINLQFKPFGLYSFKGIPATEYQNITLTLDIFFSGSESEELLDRMYSLSSLSSKFRELEKFLSLRINSNCIDDRIFHAVNLFKNSITHTMDDLSNEVCLSPRRFRELFSEHVGFSPSFYKKIVRFNKAAKQIAARYQKSLTDVALENNYFDQSHFIKDFKFFAGVTPSQFLKHKANSTDFYNFNLTDLENFTTRTR